MRTLLHCFCLAATLLLPGLLRSQCITPSHFSLFENSYSHAVLEWEPADNVTSWKLMYMVYDNSHHYQYSVTDTVQLTADSTGLIHYALDTLPSGKMVNAYLGAICDSTASYLCGPLSFCTPCQPLQVSELPYHYGFEDYANSPGWGTVIDACWWLSPQSNTDSTGRPSSNTAFHVDGSRSLFLNASSAMPRTWVSAPLVGDSLNHLEVAFQVFGSNYPTTLEVGVMSNPMDYNTFVSFKSFDITTLNQWIPFVMTFDGYEGNEGFITFMLRGQGMVFLDDYNVRRISCPIINNVSVRDVTPTSAFIEWQQDPNYPVQPQSYEITVTDFQGQVDYIDTLSQRWTTVGGLQQSSFYTVSVKSLCDTCHGSPSSYSFATRSFACESFDTSQLSIDTIGHGAGTDYRIPMFSGSHYSRSQQIFRASELGGPRLLTGLAVMPSMTSASRRLKVFLAHTADTNLSGYCTPPDMTLVFDDTVDVVADQWSMMELNAPFSYNGQGNLLVTFYEDNPVQTGSMLQFYVHTAYSGASRYDYKSTYAGLGDGTPLSVRNNMLLVGSSCDSSAACAAPLVRVVDSSASMVSLVWAAGGSETEWTLEYRQSVGGNWTVVADTSATAWTVTGLQSDCDYRFRVSYACGDTLYATVRNVHTPCVDQILPFSETFASWPTGNQQYLPTCWHKGTTGTNNSPYGTYFQHMGDHRSLLFNYTNSYSSGGYYSYLVLPKMEAPVDTLILSFYMFIEYASYNQNMRIGVVDNPIDMSTFREVGLATQSTPGQWEMHQFTFDNIDDGYITFLTPNSGSATVYIDNIEVDYFNPCQPPVNIVLDSIDHHDAYLSWDDNDAMLYQVQYGSSGFSLGSGTTVNASTNHVMLNNLVYETSYDVYVRAVCDAQHTSAWNGPFQFFSGCNTIDALPYTENFNGMGVGMYPPPACWGHGSGYNSAYPQVNSSLNHGSGSGSMLYFLNNDYYNVGRYTYANLPALSSSVANVNQTQLHFYVYSLTQGGPYPLVVGVSNMSGDISTFQPVDTVWAYYNEWIDYDVYLDSYTGTGRYIMFLQYSIPQTTGNSLCIDDVTLLPVELCHKPTGLQTLATTQNSVTVEWQDRAGASQWLVEYGPVGFQPGTGTSVMASSNPFTLTNVPSNYNGHYYVRALCSGGDTSGYNSYPGAFVTQQQPASVPYNYDFETGTEWLNWTAQSNSNTHFWKRDYYPPMTGDTGTHCMFMAYNNDYFPYQFNSTVNAVAFRDFNISSPGDYLLSFDARAGGPIYDEGDGLRVFLVDPDALVQNSSSYNTTPWGPVDSVGVLVELCTDTVWHRYTAYLENLSGQQRLVFYWGNINRPYHVIRLGGAVDNISLAPVTCRRPTNVHVETLGVDNATLSWQGTSGATYEVICENDRDGATQPVVYTCSGTNLSITGLQQAHRYRCTVRSVCALGDYSEPSEVVHFTTDSCQASFWSQMGDDAHMVQQSFYSPLNLISKYSVNEIIITEDELDSVMTDLSGVAFYFMGQRTLEEKRLVEIFLMPTEKSSFADINDGVNLSADAVKVYTGSLSCQQGWNYFGFDNYYHYTGSGNLIMVVNDLSGIGLASQTAIQNEFGVRRCDSVLTWTVMGNNSALDLDNISSPIGSKYVFNYRPEMRLYSCGTFYCEPPSPELVELSFDRATLLWHGGEGVYELQITDADDTVWNDAVVVADTVFEFTDLVPDGEYRYRLRRLCDSLRQSDWVEGGFYAAHLDCFTPQGLNVGELTTSTAEVRWTGHPGDTLWQIHLWNTMMDTLMVVDTVAVTLTGLASDVSYNVAVATVCGNGILFSDETAAVEFTTEACQQVTGVEVSEVTSHSAVVRWNPLTSLGYRVEYGEPGFGEGTGFRVELNDEMLVISNLEPDFQYELYVQAICGPMAVGTWSEPVYFTTSPSGFIDADGKKVLLHPNPARGMVNLELKGFNGSIEVSVVDITGRDLRSFSLTCHGFCSQQIELSDLPRGAYFVHVCGDQENYVRKLILK